MNPDGSLVAETAAPTLELVARAAGVSVSTVSRALRNNRQIAVATRQHVHAVAQRLGYRPNPYVSVLMSHVRQTRPAPYTATLAWIDRLPPNAWRENPVQTQFFTGAVARAQALGFTVERIPCRDRRLTRARVTDILVSRGINGVLCSADTPDSRLMTLPLEVRNVAVATVGCRFTKPDLHFSTNDQFATASLAHRRLLGLGYRKVGFVTSRALEQIVDHRFAGGYLSVLAGREPEAVMPIHFVDDAAAPPFGEWLRRHRPDVVLTTYMVEVLTMIHDCGLSVPRDIGFAMLDRDHHSDGMAGVRQFHDRVGAAAVDVLVSQLQRSEFGLPVHAQGVLIEGEWVDGWTAPPRS